MQPKWDYLFIYIYWEKSLLIYWGKKCLWGKVSRSGRGLGEPSDHSADLTEGSFRLKHSVLQGPLQGWWREGPFSSSYPAEENGFSQNWAYLISLLRVCGKCSLCAKETVNSECTIQAFHQVSPYHKRPELPWPEHRKTCDHEKVGSYTKIAISLSHISKVFTNIWVQNGQDGVEASLITTLETQWEKKQRWQMKSANHLTANFLQKMYSLKEQVETTTC